MHLLSFKDSFDVLFSAIVDFRLVGAHPAPRIGHYQLCQGPNLYTLTCNKLLFTLNITQLLSI